MNIEQVVTNILTKVAAQKEQEMPKKEEKKKEVKGMGDACKYASQLADILDEIKDNFDVNFGSPIEQALAKTAYESPNALQRSEATGVNFKGKNEHRDVMAKVEDPAHPHSPTVKTPTVNHLETTIKSPPGGKEKVSPASPPLLNKAASAYEKVLAKLAYDSPNALERLEVDQSGKGQQGWDGAGFENAGRDLIQSGNSEAMHFTSANAKKEYIRKSMGEVFDTANPSADTATRRFVDRGAETSKLAGLEEAKKMEAMAKKEVSEEKKEEKVAPGIHAKVEKTAIIGDMLANGLTGGLAIPGAGLYGYMKGREMGQGGEQLDQASLPGFAVAPLTYGAYRLGKGIGHQSGDTEHKLLNQGSEKAPQSSEKKAEEKCTCNGKGTCEHCKKSVKHASECTCSGKGTCEHCKEKAMKKAASILLNLKLAQDMLMMDANGTGGTPGGMDMGQGMPGDGQQAQVDPAQIEKMKKILLMLQLKKQQEEAAMQQGQASGNMQVPAEMTSQTPMGGVQGV